MSEVTGLICSGGTKLHVLPSDVYGGLMKRSVVGMLDHIRVQLLVGWLQSALELLTLSGVNHLFLFCTFLSRGAWLLLALASDLPDLGLHADPLFQGWVII